MQLSGNLSLLLFTILNNKSDIKCLYLKKTLIDFSNKRKICDIVCKIGDASLLKYAHENGNEFELNITLVAAVGGHLDCLKYVYENNMLIWHPKTTYIAAKHGHLSCLKYAYENGCPWDPMTVLGAMKNKHIDCVKYAHEVHLKMIEDTNSSTCELGGSSDIYFYSCNYKSDVFGHCSYDYHDYHDISFGASRRLISELNNNSHYTGVTGCY